MVSPWINKGTVVHEASGPTPSSHFDHTSVPATMKKVFNLPAFLTKRDAWAGTFEDVVMQRSEPRTDCPMTLPEVPDLATEDLEAEQNAPLTDLQEELLDWAIALHAKGGSLHPLERAKVRNTSSALDPRRARHERTHSFCTAWPFARRFARSLTRAYSCSSSPAALCTPSRAQRSRLLLRAPLRDAHCSRVPPRLFAASASSSSSSSSPSSWLSLH
jgi:hypothetical protein